MDYIQAIDYIHSIPKFSRVLGNAALLRLLSLLGNPQSKLRYIHIAGTNGKGSTAAMCERILTAAGYKTGLFTSPYIERYNERIQISGNCIGDDELAALAEEVKRTAEENDAPVSEFAFGAAMAFLYFARNECDYVVLEVGMGGLLDATNVIDEAQVCVITSIGLDHTQYLGDTIEKIAAEKCGIIKQGNDVVAYMPQTDDALGVIRCVCEEKNARLTLCQTPKLTDSGFIYEGNEYKTGLRGAYQPYNAAAVIEVMKCLSKKGAHIPQSAIYDGIANVKWCARFEFLTERFIIDGSHNIDGMRTLAQSLERLGKPVTLVVAMLGDKNHERCIEYIARFGERVIATGTDMERFISAEEAAAETMRDAAVVDSAEEAVRLALSLDDNVVCVCGSLYFAGNVRRMFNAGKFDDLLKEDLGD